MSSGFEVIVNTKDLLYILNISSSIIEKKNVTSELSNIKISTHNNIIEVIATDMDLSLSNHIGAQILNSGCIVLDAKILTNVIQKISDEEIQLKHNESENQISIIGEYCSFNLNTTDADKFPNIDDIDSYDEITIPCKTMVKLIEYTQFSISKDETRYNLNGISLKIDNGFLYSATTDGHRLSVSGDIINNINSNINYNIILPRKTSYELLKIIKDSKYINHDLKILITRNQIKFICNNIFLISRLIDAQFPDYNSFIPTTKNNKLSINPKLFANIIERVSTVTIDKFRAIKLNITKEFIEISAFGESRGSAQEKLIYSTDKNNYCQFEGEEEIIIGFNPKYLTDVLNIVQLDQINIYLNSPVSPAWIQIPSNDYDQFIIMPVKV